MKAFNLSQLVRNAGRLVALMMLVLLVRSARAQMLPPRITSITLAGDRVEVAVSVPPGVQRVVLESSRRSDLHGWMPRGVRTVNGASLVTFLVSAETASTVELFRVRADETMPLPASFYSGRTNFAGEAVGETEGSVPTPGLGSDMVIFGTTTDVATLGPVADPGDTTLRTVAESDIWRVHGDRIYFYNSTRGLQIIDIADPDAPKLLGSLRITGTGEQMYLLGDDHVILLVGDRCDGGNTGHAIIVNVAGDLPREVARVPLDGWVLESRLVGHALYVATQTWGPIGTSDVWRQGVKVQAFDLAQPDAPVVRNNVRLEGAGSVVTATPTHLFVATATNGWPRLDVLHVFDIEDPVGTVLPVGQIPLGGALLDKFKLHQQGDLLAVVTEVRSDKGIGSELITYRLPMGGTAGWQRLGSVRFGEGESLFATRFAQSRLYAVTYRRTDPLWVVDFADAAHPSINGELVIPGWSTYIHPLGDRLLTIGIDDTAGNRVAVQLFDVADPAKPALLSKSVLGNGWSTSEALGNEKAFGVFPEAGLVLVPVSSSTTNGYVEAVQLLDLSSNAVTARGAFTEAAIIPRRTVLRGKRALAISTRELLGIDLTDRDAPTLKSRLELGYPVDRVLPVGDWLVEFSGNEVHVSSATKPGVALRRYELEGPPVLGATVAGDRLHLLQGQRSDDGYMGLLLWPGNQPPGSTNAGTMRHAILDAGSLPDLSQLGAVSWKTKTTATLAEVEPLWPQPNTLVWSAREQRYWWNTWIGLPFLDVMDFAPFRSYGQPLHLLAVDVGDSTRPRFLSETSVGESAQNTSATFSADGLVFASQAIQHSEIVSTNFHVWTNRVWVTVTNDIWRTNLVVAQTVTAETNLSAPFTVPAIRFHQAGDALSGGWFHSLLLNDGGDVFAWGDNAAGAAGVSGSGLVSAPARVALTGPMSAVAAGNWQSFALGRDGAVWNWGSLDGSLPPLPGQPPPGYATPRKVALPYPMAAISAGGWHTMALEPGGQLWAWGHNEQGQLGLGHRDFVAEPQPVPGSLFRSVAGGALHSLALDQQGRVWSWGRNDLGQLGRDGLQEFPEPVAFPVDAAFRAVAAASAHSLALAEDGTLWGWGHNVFHQLGHRPVGSGLAPAPITGLPAVRSIAAGTYHSLALAENGDVWLLGREPASQTPVMARVQGLQHVRAIAAGRQHSLAVTDTGDLFVWGANLSTVGGSGEPATFTLASQLPVVAYRTNGVLRTNVTHELVLSRELQDQVITNAVPVTRYWNQHELVAADFSQDPTAPVLREPVSLPGLLAGISHDGALLYCTARLTDVQADTALHALAYDGLAAHLVDTLALPASSQHNTPLVDVAPDGNIVAARSVGTTNTLSRIETWRLGSTGVFARLGFLERPSDFSDLRRLGTFAALRSQTGFELVDFAVPATPRLLPVSDALDCLGRDLKRLQGDRATGLWLPAGEPGSLPLWRP
jgi:alpha-tubulin suppressor-like RCC1 family protein